MARKRGTMTEKMPKEGTTCIDEEYDTQESEVEVVARLQYALATIIFFCIFLLVNISIGLDALLTIFTAMTTATLISIREKMDNDR